jgi:hypothetical protein
MMHPVDTPKFDIGFALAQTAVWHRYRKKVSDRIEVSPGSVYLKAVCEHCTRLQRLAEGLTAFATTGVQEEVMWLWRPCFEVFASQAILQFGHVNHRDGRAASKDEKAAAYYLHGDFLQKRMILKHRTPGRRTESVGYENRIVELDERLRSSPIEFKEDKPWHGCAFEASVRKALRAVKANVPIAIGRLEPVLPKMTDFFHTGIHGNSFHFRFLSQSEGEGVIALLDDRSPRNPNHSMMAVVLALSSIHMLANEFNEAPLIMPMFDSVCEDIESAGEHLIGHFPTAMIPLTRP